MLMLPHAPSDLTPIDWLVRSIVGNTKRCPGCRGIKAFDDDKPLGAVSTMKPPSTQGGAR